MQSIEELRQKRMGFITVTELREIVVPANRFQPILVRCGGGRFVCPAQDALHFVNIVDESERDHVRDISIHKEA